MSASVGRTEPVDDQAARGQFQTVARTSQFAGKQRLTINGDRVTMREGEFVHMSPNVPHGARSTGGAVVLDVFTPIGADWKD